MAVKIKYKDVTTEYDNTNLTLKCANKKMLSDVEIEVVGVTIITFTVGSTTYQAESGMNWYDWVESEYNTDGWRIEGTTMYKGNIASNVVLSNTIADGEKYATYLNGPAI